MKFLFWFSLLFIIYTYLGYPLLLLILSHLRKRDVLKGDILPKVSFIIAAYNEERQIKDKIENTLAIDYPRDKFEIIIVSDASTDKTDSIIKSYVPCGIKFVRLSERRGKETAQKQGIDISTGDILVFSDVATILRPDAVLNIVKNFQDPSVGCVSSTDRILSEGKAASGESLYVRYEMFLRKLESKCYSLVGLSGSFFAARREVCPPWSIDCDSDFYVVLNSIKKGFRGVLDLSSIGYYKSTSDGRKEYRRKLRTIVRGIHTFFKNISLLNLFKYKFFSLQLFSHKLCRWLVPFSMIALFVSNLYISSNTENIFYNYSFMGQCIFYITGLVSMKLKKFSSFYIFKIPSFFIMVNLSVLNAWLLYLKGRRIMYWEPTDR